MIAPFYATAQIAAQQHVRQIEIEANKSIKINNKATFSAAIAAARYEWRHQGGHAAAGGAGPHNT